MGSSYNTGQVSATIVQNITSGSAITTSPGIPTGATIVTINSSITGQAITASYTTLRSTTGGKVFYMTGIQFGLSTSLVEISDNGTAKGTFVCNGLTNPSAVTLTTPISFATNIQMKSTGAATAYFTIIGYEV